MRKGCTRAEMVYTAEDMRMVVEVGLRNGVRLGMGDGVFLRRGGAISSDRGVRIFFVRALWGGFFLARELQEVIGERRMNIIPSNSKT